LVDKRVGNANKRHQYHNISTKKEKEK